MFFFSKSKLLPTNYVLYNLKVFQEQQTSKAKKVSFSNENLGKIDIYRDFFKGSPDNSATAAANSSGCTATSQIQRREWENNIQILVLLLFYRDTRKLET